MIITIDGPENEWDPLLGIQGRSRLPAQPAPNSQSSDRNKPPFLRCECGAFPAHSTPERIAPRNTQNREAQGWRSQAIRCIPENLQLTFRYRHFGCVLSSDARAT